MSKKIEKTKKTDKNKNLEKIIMTRITTGSVVMKPHWYFTLGSILMIVSLVGLSIAAIFLTNLSFFSLRQHGPMGDWRLQLMLQSFPWWLPILAMLGIAAAVTLLRRYDFSYKRNFNLIVLVFVAVIILAAIIIDQTGVNDMWFGRGRWASQSRWFGQGQRVMQNRGYGMKNFGDATY